MRWLVIGAVIIGAALLFGRKGSGGVRVPADPNEVLEHVASSSSSGRELKALDRGLTGRHHLTNSGFCSRYEWAKLILQSLGIDKFIRPVTMDIFQLPAKRPQFSAMSNDRIARLLDLSIPAWDEGVKSYLQGGGLTREE